MVRSPMTNFLSGTDMVFRNYYWRQNPNLQAYIQSVEGLFIGEIVSRLNQVIYKNMTERYVHVFAHDGMWKFKMASAVTK